MVLGLSLGLLGLLGVALGVKNLTDSGVIGGASSPLSSKTDFDSISENSKEFAERYMSESVIDSSSSPQPYISSPELTRPQSSNNGDNKDNKSKKDFANKVKYSTIGGAVGYTAKGVLDSVEEISYDAKQIVNSIDWSVVLLLGGAFLVYKWVKE